MFDVQLFSMSPLYILPFSRTPYDLMLMEDITTHLTRGMLVIMIATTMTGHQFPHTDIHQLAKLYQIGQPTNHTRTLQRTHINSHITYMIHQIYYGVAVKMILGTTYPWYRHQRITTQGVPTTNSLMAMWILTHYQEAQTPLGNENKVHSYLPPGLYIQLTLKSQTLTVDGQPVTLRMMMSLKWCHLNTTINPKSLR